MEDQKAKLLTRIQETTNVLVTVSNNPSLDQLAGAIGLTLLLNKMGKHGTAVFSGEVPSIIEYLEPEETIEKNTDSLRDFIIALDKSKADKLRYKVEDKMVKIFITPYRTSISEKDQEFSQGDFNVDLVIAIGAHEVKDLDRAITAHGRILHDATVSSINNQDTGHVGTINWIDTTASSLCEMLYTLTNELKPDSLDGQMATAFLTGIVSETIRFGNEKTTAKTMDISSHLMAAGANQQLVAAKLESLSAEPPEEEVKPLPSKEPAVKPVEPPKTPIAETPDKVFKPAPRVKEDKNDGALQVEHEETPTEADADLEEIRIDEHGVLYRPTEEKATPQISTHQPLMNSHQGALSSTEPVAEPSTTTNSSPTTPSTDEEEDMMPLPEPQPDAVEDQNEDNQTLTDIEKSVDSPHQGQVANESIEPVADLSSARDAVMDAVSAGADLMPPPPRIDLNANPGLELNQDNDPATPALETNAIPAPLSPTSADNSAVSSILPPAPLIAEPVSGSPTFPANLVSPQSGLPADNTAAPLADPTAPPPVPPPMMPPGFGSTPTDDEKPQELVAPL